MWRRRSYLIAIVSISAIALVCILDWSDPVEVGMDGSVKNGYPADVSLQITPIPDRTTWKANETITGKMRFVNTGKRKLSIHPIALEQEQVTDAQGNEAQRIEFKTFICGTMSLNRPNVTIAPGKSYDHPFYIRTDPLNDRGGFLLPPGSHNLAYSTQLLSGGTTLVAKTATIQITSPPNDSPEGRIVQFGCGGNRILVLRQAGIVQAFDIDTGQKVASLTIPEYQTNRYRGPFVGFSPDGRLVAVVRANGTVTLHDLDQPESQPAVINFARQIGHESYKWWFLRFDRSNQHVYLVGEPGVVQVATGGEHAAKLTATTRWPEISPDGDYLGWLDGQDQEGPLRIIPQDPHGHSVNINTPPGRRLTSRYYMGLHGAYAAKDEAPHVVYGRYDGSGIVNVPTKAIPEVESPEGELLALTTASVFDFEAQSTPNILEIWDITANRKLCEVSGKQFRLVDFVSDPLRLVCATAVRGDNFFHWLDGTIEVYDPRTGKLLKTHKF